MLLSSYWHLTSQLLNLFVYYFCRWDSIVCLFFSSFNPTPLALISFWLKNGIQYRLHGYRMSVSCFTMKLHCVENWELICGIHARSTFIYIKKRIFILCEKRVKSNVLTFIQVVIWCDLPVKNRRNRRICLTQFEVKQQQLCLSSILIPNCVHSDCGSAVNKLKTKSFQLLN